MTLTWKKSHDKIKAAYEASSFTEGVRPEPEDALKQFEVRYAPVPAEYRWLLVNFGGLDDGSIVFLDWESSRVRGYHCDYADLEEIAENFSGLGLSLVEQALELEQLCGEW